MPIYKHYHDTVHWHMSDITSRIVAESGRPSDRFHLGKVILQGLRDSPDLLAQIEGTSGDSETNSSILERTVRCATALKKLGLQAGDVIVLMAPHHLDLVVPFYAALYLGVIVAPIDRLLGINELKDTFTISKPKVVFCQNEKVEDIKKALKALEITTKVITFENGDGDMNFSELMEHKCSSEEVKRFRCSDFDPEDSVALLISTSGSTGMPKQAAATHKNLVVTLPYLWSKTVEVPSFDKALVISPLQWLSAGMLYMVAPSLKLTRVQSVRDATQEHVYDLINKYRPSVMIISPTMLTTLLRPGDRDKCDFSCFERIYCGGSAVSTSLQDEYKKVMPKADILNAYGMSEACGSVFMPGFSSPSHSCGKPIGCLQYRLVDIETGKDINEPHVNGELWLKGPGIIRTYYNNPEINKTVHEGDWFKSGDMFYRDKHWNFYFVERLKLLLKYKNHQISPVELESVLCSHPGVLDAAVCGVPHAECGELPVAFVVRAPGHSPTEQELKDYVKENLADSKQLRGGVVFLEELPLTPTTKLHRRKIKEMAIALKKE